MIAQIQDVDKSYVRFVELLRQLHDLIAQGGGDSQEADALRDEMDVHVRHLTEAQVDRVEGLSADLYSLTGNELCAPEHRSNPLSEAELTAAWGVQDFDRVLTLLRRPTSFLSADLIAMLRGLCWRQLGDLETALLFYRRACHLDPKNEQCLTLLIYTLLELGQMDKARECANELIQRQPEPTAIGLLKSAFALSASIDALPAPEQKQDLLRAIDTIDRASSQNKSLPEGSRISDSDLFRYLLVQSDCYARLAQLQLPDLNVCATNEAIPGTTQPATTDFEIVKHHGSISGALSAIQQRDEFYRAVIDAEVAEDIAFATFVHH